MKSIKDFDVENKRILVRCDFNVPLDKSGKILDDFKIKRSLPTIKYLVENKAKIILMSHLDPAEEGFVSPEFTLKPVAQKLSENLGFNIEMAEDSAGPRILEKSGKLNPGNVLLLENLRFHKGETENTDEFAKKLAEMGDVYINDAFASCHRAHASIVGVPKYLPYGMGILLLQEIESLSRVLKNPERPLVVLMGGAKIKTKVKFIQKISDLADFVLIGSLLEKEIIEKHLKLNHPEKIIDHFADLTSKDLDEETINRFKKIILSARTIFWNGPFGKFEDEKYKNGTLEIAKAIIDSGAFSVAGGGETIEFLNREGMIQKFSWISTGGGAMLDYMSGNKLPGLKALGYYEM